MRYNFKHQRFEPRGIVWDGHPEIKTTDSVVDYIFTFLEKEFLEKKIIIPERKNVEKLEEEIKETEKISPDQLGNMCPVCGEQMMKKGHCFEICLKCKHENQNGCGG